jgi:hypothetical protein
MSSDPIAAYSETPPAPLAAVCRALRKAVDAALPKAESRIWHAMPVWFVGENPVVGFKASKHHVTLLFWSGQDFEEPGLEAAGSFHAAQAKFASADELDEAALRRWLKKAGTRVRDYAGLRSGRPAPKGTKAVRRK